MDTVKHQGDISENGFAVIVGVFSATAIDSILNIIASADSAHDTFRKSSDLFAIRQFLKEVPDVVPFVFSKPLEEIINGLFGTDYFVIKSIYFDKPEQSNWFVAYHQDLTISVNTKKDLPDFGPWTVKQNQFGVQPPLAILEENFTIRIHLDDTDEHNGALKVISGSHAKGSYRPEQIDWTKEKETVCNVPKGGIMIMRPLLLHASGRTTDNRKRRVIHIEFGKRELPEGLLWSEYLKLST